MLLGFCLLLIKSQGSLHHSCKHLCTLLGLGPVPNITSSVNSHLLEVAGEKKILQEGNLYCQNLSFFFLYTFPAFIANTKDFHLICS